MIGAGQLARMTHQAAIALGVEVCVLARSDRDSAVLAGAPFRIGSPSSVEDLLAATEGCDVVTFDHELIPLAHLAELQRRGRQLHPAPSALRLAQDKSEARSALFAAGFPLPGFAPVSSIGDVEDFASQHKWPVVLKRARGGYDGRGVHVVESAEQAFRLLAPKDSQKDEGAPGGEWIAEQFVELAAELTILLARDHQGRTALYPPIQTVQREGMLRHLLMPAPLSRAVTEEAAGIATAIAEAVGATGILAVEMFLDSSGTLSVNELAMRPHNSGHATIEAAETSQFEQHLRAVLGWPLGPTTLRSPAATVNLIGGAEAADPALRLPAALAVGGVHVHLYAKATRPGRKLGHVTALGSDPAEALERAEAAAAILTGR